MFGHSPKDTAEKSNLKKAYIANYNYTQETEFRWDASHLGEMDENDFNELNAQLLKYESITKLNFDGSKIGNDDEAINALIHLLEENAQIEYVNLSGNHIQDHQALKILNELRYILKHMFIDFSNNPNLTDITLKEAQKLPLHPSTAISLIKNHNQDKNPYEGIVQYLKDKEEELLEIEEESRAYQEEKEANLANPSLYTSELFEWYFDKFGPATRSDLLKLNTELQKYKHITGVSFYGNRIGRTGGAINALIQILIDNPQINFVNLQYNWLLDRHIEKIIEKVPASQLNKLYIQANANLLTEKSVKLAYKHLDPRSVTSMGHGNKRINRNDPETVECLDKAREMGRKIWDETAKPKVSEGNMFTEKAKQQEATSPKQRESSFEEKTHDTTTPIPSIKNIFKKQV